eukprot:COSAG06_NODE_3102_length_5858_cov_6.861087_1_plen_261_part_00
MTGDVLLHGVDAAQRAQHLAAARHKKYQAKHDENVKLNALLHEAGEAGEDLVVDNKALIQNNKVLMEDNKTLRELNKALREKNTITLVEKTCVHITDVTEDDLQKISVIQAAVRGFLVRRQQLKIRNSTNLMFRAECSVDIPKVFTALKANGITFTVLRREVLYGSGEKVTMKADTDWKKCRAVFDTVGDAHVAAQSLLPAFCYDGNRRLFDDDEDEGAEFVELAAATMIQAACRGFLARNSNGTDSDDDGYDTAVSDED